MEFARLVFTFEHRHDAAKLSHEFSLFLDCSSADTVMVAASLADERLAECGVWLNVSSDYSAQIAARDVATLATMIPLRHVVVASSSAREHAEVVRALLSDEEVNFTNEVATLRGAYNRPAPSRSLTVWSYDGTLLSGDIGLEPQRTDVSDVGELTYFG